MMFISPIGAFYSREMGHKELNSLADWNRQQISQILDNTLSAFKCFPLAWNLQVLSIGMEVSSTASA